MHLYIATVQPFQGPLLELDNASQTFEKLVSIIGISTIMASDPTQATGVWEKPLVNSFYDPDDDAKEFFRKETGITNDDELKQHILKAQAKAFSVSLLFTCQHP